MARNRMLSVLLTVLVRTTYTNLDIKIKGESHGFQLRNDVDYCLLFRSSKEENLLLWNTSNPLENSTLATEFKDRLDMNSSFLQINKLTQSDSGLYRMEFWQGDQVLYWNSTLFVCSNQIVSTVLYANPEETVELQCEGTNDGDNMTVRWFKKDVKERKIVQLSEDKSTLITNISIDDIWYFYYICVILDRQDCVSRQIFNPQLQRHYVALPVGEEAVLPCFNHNDPMGTETRWRTSGYGYIGWDTKPFTSGVKQTFVSDGRKSGIYSLVIPSLGHRHSGLFFCYDQLQERETFIIGYKLIVCSKSKQLTEFLSVGEEVVLSCNSDLNESDGVIWYRQSSQGAHVILDTRSDKLAYSSKDLNDRIHSSDPYSFLVLSNLSLADSGEYWCAVFYKEVCVSVTKTVLLEWDPFGINSTFYRVYSSLMVCALLVMVCVVITVNLKTRRRDQEERPGGETRRRDQEERPGFPEDQEKRPGFPEDQEDFSPDTETKEQYCGKRTKKRVLK